MTIARWLTRPWAIAASIVVLLAGTALVFWATDYGVKADVVEKRCPSASLFATAIVPSIVVRTRIGGYERTFDVRPDECLGIPDGAFVVYHMRTERVLLYDSEGGRCVYDSSDSDCR